MDSRWRAGDRGRDGASVTRADGRASEAFRSVPAQLFLASSGDDTAGRLQHGPLVEALIRQEQCGLLTNAGRATRGGGR